MKITCRSCKVIFVVTGLLYCLVRLSEIQHYYDVAGWALSPSLPDINVSSLSPSLPDINVSPLSPSLPDINVSSLSPSLPDINVSTKIENNDDNGMQSVENIFTNRNDKLKRVCTEYSIKKDPRYNNLFNRYSMVDRQRGILLCQIPKIASTSFMKIFLTLAGVSDVYGIFDRDIHTQTFQSKITFVKDIKDSSRVIQSYEKFIFVRNPLERLLSAYIDKLSVKYPADRELIYSQLQKLYRDNPALNKSKITHCNDETCPLTFTEFLQFVTDWYSSGSVIKNHHFLDYHRLCSVCHETYDFIGKYETLVRDARYIFSRLDINITFPAYAPRPHNIGQTVSLVEEYYRPLPLELRKKVFDIVKMDALLFGYTFPKWFLHE